MTASFGKLDGETLSLHEGLNVIVSPNESGKSTWCAFLRVMLYGIDSGERERAGFKPDKLRYAPWSGAPMAGELTLSHGGADITLRRWSKGAGSPMREFSAVYTGTENPVPGLNGESVGERLTGVPRAVFERSAFIAQAGLGVSGGAELEKRIAAIVSTGEESGSYSETESRLKAWQRKRHFRQYGEIPALESELAELESAREGSHRELAELEEVLARSEQVQRGIDILKRRVEDSRKVQRRQALEALSQAREELGAGQNLLETARAELAAAQADLNAGPFGSADPQALQDEVERDVQSAADFARAAERPPKSGYFAAAGSFALFLAALALGVLVSRYCLVPAALFLAGSAVAVGLLIGRRRGARRELKALLEKYGAASPQEISDAFHAHAAAFARVETARRTAGEAARDLERLSAGHRALETRLLGELDFSSGDSEAAALGRRLSAAQGELSALRERRAALEGRLGALGDPLVYQTEILRKRARLQELTAQYDAIQLALETLRDADNELQTRFSPLLARKAAEYLSRLTLGRYGELSIAKDFSMRLRESGGPNMRETAFLSAGTVDQVYLALRLAICALALPDADPCPLVLDDALVNFDTARATAAVELFQEIAETRQVIFFSCG